MTEKMECQDAQELLTLRYNIKAAEQNFLTVAEENAKLKAENNILKNKLTMAQYAEVQEMLRGDIRELKAEIEKLKGAKVWQR